MIGVLAARWRSRCRRRRTKRLAARAAVGNSAAATNCRGVAEPDGVAASFPGGRDCACSAVARTNLHARPKTRAASRMEFEVMFKLFYTSLQSQTKSTSTFCLALQNGQNRSLTQFNSMSPLKALLFYRQIEQTFANPADAHHRN